MTKPMTKNDFRELIVQLDEDEQRELMIVTQATREKYHRLRRMYVNQAQAAPEKGPNENSKGTPPNENSNTTPPPTKIEYKHPCGGDMCMNSPCCEDGMN